MDERAAPAAVKANYGAARAALVAEDDPHIAELVRDCLSAQGFDVSVAPDGQAALRRAREHEPDVVILDIGLPGIDGLELCRMIRKESAAPIVFLSARGSEIDRVVGLELGADDYLAKPFSPRELVARVRAILRRAKAPAPETAHRRTAGVLAIDSERREAHVNGVAIRLKPREFDLLWLLVRNEGRVFTRDQLIEAVWGFDWEGDPRTVDVHVRRIRRALDAAAPGLRYLQTVHGLGYKFSTRR